MIEKRARPISLHLWLSVEERDQLAALATMREQTRSDVLRHLISLHYLRPKHPNSNVPSLDDISLPDDFSTDDLALEIAGLPVIDANEEDAGP